MVLNPHEHSSSIRSFTPSVRVAQSADNVALLLILRAMSLKHYVVFRQHLLCSRQLADGSFAFTKGKCATHTSLVGFEPTEHELPDRVWSNFE